MSNETTPVHTPRYALDRERIGLVADATGNWVQVTDYWTVEDERDRLLATTAKLREALTELLDARGTSLNIVGHDPVSGHPLSREGMAALKARAALSSTTP